MKGLPTFREGAYSRLCVRRGCSLGSRNEKTKPFADGKSFTDCDDRPIWDCPSIPSNGLRTQTNPSPQKTNEKRREKKREEERRREKTREDERRRSAPLGVEAGALALERREEKRRLPPPVLKQWASGFQSSCSSSVRRRLGYLSLV